MGGDPPAPQTNESTAKMLQAYQQYLPGVANAAAGAIMPTELAQLMGSAAVSPGYAQLNTDLLNMYGPGYSQAVSNINNQQAMSTAQQDLNVLNGPGRQLVSTANDVARIADPEYYASRAQVGGGISQLLSGMDPNHLTPQEIEAQTRGLSNIPGAVNPAGSPSNTTAIANAGTFGDALAGKRNQYMQALQTATGALQPLKSGVDVLQQATGKSSGSNLGQTQFSGVQGDSKSADSISGNLLGQVGALQQQSNQINSTRDPYGRVNSIAGGVGSTGLTW